MLREQLQLLSRLQEIDDQIRIHEDNLTRLPLEAQELARRLVGVRREIAQTSEKLAEVEKELRQKEGAVEAEQQKIKRSEKRLLNIKNQKEYNALSREIKIGKKVVAELEEMSLRLMGEAESHRKALERKEADYRETEASLGEKKAEIDRVSRDAEESLVRLRGEKETIQQAVEREFYRKYETVRRALGTAIVELENGSCTGCHMAIPPQLNIIVLKQEEMACCPSCQRILYVKPENIPEFNKME